MKSVNLPNGMSVLGFNENEVRVLHYEIFTQQSYLKNGIQVCDGDCIFDIGANIGLYTIFLSSLCKDLKILAFEPIPDIFAVLKNNVKNILTTSEIKTFNFGLSSKSRIFQFEFNQRLSFASTMYSQEIADCVCQDSSEYDWARAIIRDMQKISIVPSNLAQALIKMLSIPFLKSVCLAILNQFLIGSTKKTSTKQVNCQLKTISEVIREENIVTIDLVKIDAEGSELDIVMGIDKEDWKKIKQFIVEVHDINGRLQKMTSLFREYGYHIFVEQPDYEIQKLMNIYCIYAVDREIILQS